MVKKHQTAGSPAHLVLILCVLALLGGAHLVWYPFPFLGFVSSVEAFAVQKTSSRVGIFSSPGMSLSVCAPKVTTNSTMTVRGNGCKSIPFGEKQQRSVSKTQMPHPFWGYDIRSLKKSYENRLRLVVSNSQSL